jgi:hypothetical protein
MTGELCDCFATKREGVRFILDAVERVAGGKPLHVWGTDGRFHPIQEAREIPLRHAAANWLALATWAGRLVPRRTALLVDIGSTTSDLIPLLDGKPTPAGLTDPERLRSRELVYTGVRRTPLAALLRDVAAELFATTLDAYLLLGDIEPDASDLDTADGGPATAEHAHARVARMLCADIETSKAADRIQLAKAAEAAQLAMLNEAMDRVRERIARPVETIVLSGSGEFLGRRLLSRRARKEWGTVHSVKNLLGTAASAAACAYAVAVLCRERELRP